MARAIDADALKEKFAEILESTYTDDYAKGYVNGLRAALNMPTITPPNEPLTIEQLREMDGEPVFLETGEVSIREQLIAEWEILITHNSRWFFFTRRKNGFHTKDYGKTWFAYRRPPEGEEDT